MALARRLVYAAKSSDLNPWVPAGYTYLGQFIDHDITFDPTSSLDPNTVPAKLVNFRTPRFDLDSLYGRGPLDQPYLYEKLTGREFLRFVVEMYGLDRTSASRRIEELVGTFEMADYIDNFYNVHRRHSYLGHISPTEYEKLWQDIQPSPQLS